MAYTAKYPPSHSATYVVATSTISTFYPPLSTDPALPLTGGQSNNEWISGSSSPADQKFNIDLGSAKTIARIYLENRHNSGTDTEFGIKNFLVYGSNEASDFSNVTYADVTPTMTLIDTLQAAEHVGSNIEDPQYFVLASPGSYRYYILRIADNWGGVSGMAMRHIELQSDDDVNSGSGDIELSVDSVNGVGGKSGSFGLSVDSVFGGGGKAGSFGMSVDAMFGGGGKAGSMNLSVDSINASGGKSGSFDMPGITIAATGYETETTGVGTFITPGITISASGESRSGSANFNTTFGFSSSGGGRGGMSAGGITMSGSGGQANTGVASFKAPRISLSASGEEGHWGAGDFDEPGITLSGSGYTESEGYGDFTLPGIKIRATGRVNLYNYASLSLGVDSINGAGSSEDDPGVCSGILTHTRGLR